MSFNQLLKENQIRIQKFLDLFHTTLKKKLLADSPVSLIKWKDTESPLTIRSVDISYFHPIYMHDKYAEYVKRIRDFFLKETLKCSQNEVGLFNKH